MVDCLYGQYSEHLKISISGGGVIDENELCVFCAEKGMHERGRERMWVCVNVLNAHVLVYLYCYFA